MGVLVRQPNGAMTIVQKKVKYIETSVHAVLANEENELTGRWRERARRRAHDSRVRKFFKDLPPLGAKHLPRMQTDEGAGDKAELTITNEANTELSIGMRDMEAVILEVPPNWSRTIALAPGDYEIVAAYRGKEPADTIVYQGKKISFSGAMQYHLKLGTSYVGAKEKDG